MTIREAKEKTQAVLDVLNKLPEAAGEDIQVLRISMSTNLDTEIFLNEPCMRAVVEALPHVEASMMPVDEEKYPGDCYWTMSIDGVRVFTILIDKDERKKW